MQIQFSPPDITEAEIAEVVEALQSGWITTGPKTKQLERDLSAFYQTNQTVCLNSATAAMELALRVLGIGPGDEVITSAYTYTASASVIVHVGATPVMVDPKADCLTIDPEAVRQAITPRTKAIIPVDIAGVPCDYDGLFAALEAEKDQFNPQSPIQEALGRVAILADAAHALGATYKGRPIGTIADFTCFSFHAVKNLTTAEGGAVTWNPIPGVSNQDIYDQFQLFSLHGQNKDALAKSKSGAWEYDIIAPYYKCNMTDIHAAMGLAQLRRYPDLLKRRKAITQAYNKAFEGTAIRPIAHEGPDFESSRHLYIVKVEGIGEEDRNLIIEKMAEDGVSANVHYKPLPMMTAYQKLGFDIADYPVAFAHYQNAITLPLHTLLTDEEVAYVAESLKRAISK